MKLFVLKVRNKIKTSPVKIVIDLLNKLYENY